ncbi:hypothetical protein V6C53_18975, partial [Desulfocurvibacter africanus]|uniref:hypothetical protein n=1 Tax=Desulfocurvibacter africanus TaxID=873 RepID=UPI002FDA1D90
MIILHASWLNRSLHLWAERRPGNASVPAKRRGRKPKLPDRAMSPYDPGQDGLRTALADIPGVGAPDSEGFCRAEAWL